MAYNTTVGKVLLKHYSPAETHSLLDKDLEKKNIGAFFADLAEKHPEKYEKVVSNLTRLGFESATRLGSTVSLNDLLPPKFKEAKFKELHAAMDAVKAKKLPKKKEDDELGSVLSKFNNEIDKKLVDEGVAENKTLAKVVKAGARGTAAQYRQTIFGPVAVSDNNNGVLTDFVVDRSFAEGLTLPQYLAHTFGSRIASAAGKLSVATAGYLCFTGDTEVRMGDLTTKKIKDIVAGDLVLGSDMHGNTFPVAVNHLFCNGLQSVHTYKFRKGKSRNDFIEVTATPNHEVLGSIKGGKRRQVKGKLQLANFKQSYSAKSVESCTGVAKTEIEYYKALLVGLLLGDGCLTEHSITFSNIDLELINYLNLLLKDNNLVLNKIARKRKSCEYTLSEIVESKHNLGPTGKLISGRRHPIWKLLDSLKLSGTNSYNKFIPSEVMTWNDEAVYGVIAGLIETDGCIKRSNNSSTPIISYYSASEKLTTGLQQLLSLRLGIHVNVRKVKMQEPRVMLSTGLLVVPTVPGFEISISNPEHVNKFHNLVRLPGIKESRLRQYLAKSSVYTGYNHEYSYSFISNEPAGSVEVYDIEVDHPDHLYVLANGLIVSNSKQLSRSGMTATITMHDCGSHRGIAAETNDKEYVGSFLASPVDKYNYNNEVTPSMLADLQAKHIHEIIVRSPITCEASFTTHPNSICQMCAGKRELGLPAMDSYVGVVSGSALAEPLAQSTLNSKHSGGGAKGKLAFGGQKYINQLFNIPETFVHEAPLANHDGHVEDIRVAAQGGHYVDLLNHKGKKEEHYVHPDLQVIVNKGDKVEAGDVLSQGIPNPAKIVKHKGIGEGRVYFSRAIKDTFENSGLGGIGKRNFDTIAKSLITHVKINNPQGMGNYLPDSIVNYHNIEKDYTPRNNSKKVRVDMAQGMYLETPELHYTIGTRLTSRMLDNLKKNGIEHVTVHDDHPDFEPEMQRLLDVPAHEQDWAHALYSTNLERRLLKAVNTGASSDIRGPSPVLGLAYAVGFGQKKAEEVEELLSFE